MMVIQINMVVIQINMVAIQSYMVTIQSNMVTIQINMVTIQINMVTIQINMAYAYSVRRGGQTGLEKNQIHSGEVSKKNYILFRDLATSWI